MSRPVGSENKVKASTQFEMTEAERLDYIASLIIELIDADVGREMEHATTDQ